MIILWMVYVYQVARVGFGSLKVQVKANIILHKCIVVVASGETKHIIANNVSLKNKER